MAFGITDLKKGTVFQLDGTPFRVVDYSQKVMGRGGSIVNVKIKSLVDGRVLNKTFKGNEQIEPADVTNKKASFLYADDQLHFMDSQTFEQYSLPVADNEDKKGYLKEGEEVEIQLFNGNPVNIELPKNLPLKVEYTEDAVKGDTSTSISKDARLQTGMIIKVPAFIKTGDVISVDTATGAYRERVKD